MDEILERKWEDQSLNGSRLLYGSLYIGVDLRLTDPKKKRLFVIHETKIECILVRRSFLLLGVWMAAWDIRSVGMTDE